MADPHGRPGHGGTGRLVRHSGPAARQCHRGGHGHGGHQRRLQRHPLVSSHADDFALSRRTIPALCRPPRVLCLGGFAMSFLFNLVRMSLLVWVAASKGIAAIANWHDPAGVTILRGVFFRPLGLRRLALKTPMQNSPESGSSPPHEPRSPGVPPAGWPGVSPSDETGGETPPALAAGDGRATFTPVQGSMREIRSRGFLPCLASRSSALPFGLC